MRSGRKTCHKCGTPLAFKQLPNGRWLPTNTDGSDHFDLCSQIRTHQLIADYRSAGLEPPDGYVMTEREKALFVRKPDYSQNWHVGKRLPWDDYASTKCECGTEMQIVTETSCSVTQHCVPCQKVRIETSYVV